MWLLIIISVLGFGFAGLLPKNEKALFKILLAPTLGIFVFTTLTLYISFIFGITNFSIFGSLIIISILSLICLFKFKTNFGMKDVPLLFLIFSLAIVSLLSYIWLTQALAESAEGLKTGGGGMYGDSAMHAAYTSRLETGKFPVQNPLFAGKTLVYPLASDLLSATLKIAGLNFNLAFSLPQILLLIGFLTLFYRVVKRFTQDSGFVFALLILFLGWGVGFVFFLKKWLIAGDSPWQFFVSDYTNNSAYNLHFHNILTGLILPERTFLPGLVLGLWMTFNFLEYFKNRNLRLIIINGVILGVLPFWHTHTFIFFAISSAILGFWFGFWLALEKNFRKAGTDFFVMFLVSIILASPFLILFFANHPLGDFIDRIHGWQNGNENIIVFWLKNSLLTIPLAIGGLWILEKNNKIFFVPAFVVFVIANFIVFQPWDWDNIKLLSWSFLFFAILASVFLARIFRKGIVGKTFVMIVVLISILSGLLSVGLQLKNKYIAYDKQDIELAAWAKTTTSIDDVFITETFPNHPIPGLAGRLVYVGYPGHLWVHGIDYGKRESENNRILAGDFSKFDSLDVPISYVVLTKNKISFESQTSFQEVFQNQKYTVLGKTN